MAFADRHDAGRQLAARLCMFQGPDVIALGVCRGGVPLAYEAARALSIPLDIVVVRKLGIPYQSELAFGAISEHGIRDINHRAVRHGQVSAAELTEVARVQQAELDRLVDLFRRRTPNASLVGRTVVLIDDGSVTGVTARAACQFVRAEGALRVVFAAPVCTPAAIDSLRDCADDLICLEPPQPFHACGQWYRDFDRISDERIRDLLHWSDEHLPIPTAAPSPQPPLVATPLVVKADSLQLCGTLTIPAEPIGLVVRGLASGTSRFSPGNRFVAALMHAAGLATVLVDLLTEDEELDRALVFDIDLLSRRLIAVTRSLTTRPEVADLPVGYFAAGTGAAAALQAAADPAVDIAALVCRAGRPDLASPWLGHVRAPTLHLIGDCDQAMLALNRAARSRMHCRSELVVIKGATHLFGEPGTLGQVAAAARDWFLDYLIPAHPDIAVTGRRWP